MSKRVGPRRAKALDALGPPPTEARLAAMRDALYKLTEGEALSIPMIVEISRALGYLERQQSAERMASKRGTGKKETNDAAIVRDLINEYRAEIDDAIHAVIPRGTMKEALALKQAYRRLKAEEDKYATTLVVLSPAVVAPALRRLLRQK